MALEKIKIGDPMWGLQVNDRFEETERRLLRAEFTNRLLLFGLLFNAVMDGLHGLINH